MHAAFVFLGLWAFAFVSLGLALLLLNIYSNLIDYDFMLQSVRKEAILAAICSLVEGGSVWIVATCIPAAARALIIPALLVFVIYTLAHLEDWNRFDAVLVLIFQLAIALTAGCLIAGHVGAAVIIAVTFLGALGFVGYLAKGL
jgi:hypothetical protein